MSTATGDGSSLKEAEPNWEESKDWGEDAESGKWDGGEEGQALFDEGGGSGNGGETEAFAFTEHYDYETDSMYYLNTETEEVVYDPPEQGFEPYSYAAEAAEWGGSIEGAPPLPNDPPPAHLVDPLENPWLKDEQGPKDKKKNRPTEHFPLHLKPVSARQAYFGHRLLWQSQG